MTMLLPRRPVLRPGLVVARRDDRHLQVGVDPPLRAVLPSVPAVRRLLNDLGQSRRPDIDAPEAASALRELLDLGLVVEAGPEPELAHFGAAAAERVHRKAAGSIGLRGGASTVRRRAQALLRDARLGEHDDEDGPPTVWLLLSEGEPSRSMVDDLVREGAPHLVVASRLARLQVGPFVEPGRTACLRCVDAHRAETDPRRHLVLEQAARASAEGAPEPHDPTLWALALAWAVRDLSRYLEGGRPATWSATTEIGPLDPPRLSTWARHSHCGCAWDQGLD